MTDFTPSKECLRMMEEALRRYIAAYPAFRIKPIGAPGSPARLEQENLMALEEAGERALSLLASERQRAKTLAEQIKEMEGQGE